MDAEKTPVKKSPTTRWADWELRFRTLGTHASRVTRRRLAVGYLVCVAVESAVALWRSFALTPGLVVCAVLMLMMGNAVQDIEAALDEKRARLRDVYRRRAYAVLAGYGTIVVFALLIVMSYAPSIGREVVTVVFWPQLLLGFALPTLITSWSLPELDLLTSRDTIR